MNKFLVKIFLLAMTSVLLIVAPVTRAVEVVGLYQIEIPVNDQTPKTRWRAALEGFKEILVRKSGSDQVLNAYEVKQAYRKVTAYVQRYEYSNSVNTEADLPFTLLLDFAPRLVDELIQEAGMSIWGSNRPVTILWLAFEKKFDRKIITEDSEADSFSGLLKLNAKRRGIPVILPLMDLDDELNVSLSDVWGRFNAPVVDASERYAADSVVTGRINQVGEQWQAKLSYINQSEESVVELTESSEKLLIQKLVDRLAELLCQKYCVVETLESNQISIQISNIRNFASFKRVQIYLSELSSIRKVEVDKIATTNVRFNVSLLGDLRSVKDGISLGSKLEEQSPPQSDPFASQLPDEKPLILEQPDVNQPVIPAENAELSDVDPGLSLLTDTAQPEAIEMTEPQVILYYRWNE